MPQSGLFVSKSTLGAKSDALTRLIAVQMRAWKAVYGTSDGFAEAARAVAAARPNAQINTTVIEQQLGFYRALIDTPATAGQPLGWQADSDWQKAFKTMVEAHMISEGAKTSDYYTDDLVDKAAKLAARSAVTYRGSSMKSRRARPSRSSLVSR